jgi:dienelactone hydrolase
MEAIDPRPVEYACGNTPLKGYLTSPRSGHAPLVIIAHEAMGLNPLIKARAVRLAEQGYAAFALDLYGAEDLDLPAAQTNSAELMRTPGLLRKRAFVGLEAALRLPNIDRSQCAALGYCQGGQTVLELARGGAPILAAIGVHPGFKRAEGSTDGPIRATILMMTGDEDPVVTADERAAFVDEMRSAGADWQLHVFGGVGHSFTNPEIDAFNFPGFIYDALADERSWKMTLALLDEVFRPKL